MSILQRNFNQVAFLCLINNWGILEMALSYTIHGCLSERVWQMERREWKSERERDTSLFRRDLCLWWFLHEYNRFSLWKRKKKDEVPHAWSRSRPAKVECGQVTLTAHRCTLENRSEPTCRDSTAGEYTKLTESARFDPGSKINFDTACEEWMDLRINIGSWEFIKIEKSVCFFSSALIILFGKKYSWPVSFLPKISLCCF